MKNILKKFSNQEKWVRHFSKAGKISFPSEGIIRIFLGNYPKLRFKYKKKQKILDLGYGDGRHLLFLKKQNLTVYGVEISEKINEITRKLLKKNKVNNLILKKGNNEKIPFDKEYFDHLVSWNSCYYMQNHNSNFEDHVKEMARVLKKSGYIILSIPKFNCFIFDKAKIIRKKYVVIKNDYFKGRNGQIMRRFKNVNEIKLDFSKYFKDFIISEIDMEWFGLKYSWHVVIAKKK